MERRSAPETVGDGVVLAVLFLLIPQVGLWGKMKLVVAAAWLYLPSQPCLKNSQGF